MMTEAEYKALGHKRGEIINKMKAILDNCESQGRDLSPSEQAAYDTLDAEQKILKRTWDTAEYLMGEAPRGVIDGGGASGPPVSAEANFLRHGNKSGLQVLGAMETGVGSDGGYTVLEHLHRTIIDTIAETNPILANARREVIDTNQFQQLYTISGASSGRIAEKGTRSETDTPTYARPSVNLTMQYAYPKVTEELALASSFDIAGHVAREVVTAFDADWEAEMISGDGIAPNQKGFITAADSTDPDATRDFSSFQISTTAAGPAAITSDELLDLMHSLPPRYRKNAKFYASSSCIKMLRKLKDGDGRYLLHTMGQAGDERIGILGHEIVESTQMASPTAGSKPLAFGDMMQAYAFVTHSSGLQVLRDPYTTPGYIKYYTRLLCGSGPMDTRALKVLQTAAS